MLPARDRCRVQSLRQALSRDRVALAVTVLGLLCLAPACLPFLPASAVAAFDDRLSDPLMIGVVLGVVAARAVRVGEPRERRFWSLVAAGLASYFGVQAFDAFVPLRGAVGLLLQLRNVLYVGLYVFLVIALDGKPHLPPDGGPGAGWRLRADAAAALVLGLGLWAYFSAIPELAGGSTAASRSLHSALLFGVFDAYLVLKTAEALRESRDARWRATWRLFLVAELSWLVSDAAEGLWRGGALPERAAQGLLDAAWLWPYLGLAWAARLGEAAPHAGAAAPPETSRAAGPGPLWLHAGALPVVHVLLDALGAHDRKTAGLQGTCALAVFAVNATLADLARRRLEAGAADAEGARRRAASAERLAFEDERTGLPSRHGAIRRLEALASDEARADAVVALIDIDRFRSVNSVLGDAAGDELLRAIGARLRGVVRESDFLGRFWDDEFLVVAGGLGEPGDARRLGRQLHDAFALPFRVAQTELHVTATVGVARFPARAESAAALLRGIDGAVRRGKAAGGGRVELYEPAPRGPLPGEIGFLAEPSGGAGSDLVLLYGPVVELPGRSIVGFEARLHIRHPELGPVPAREVPGLADTAGALPRQTPRLLEEACRVAASWPPLGEQRRSVTVVLAPSQLLDAELPRHVRAALARSGLEGRALILSVPGALAARSGDGALRGLQELKELGVRVRVDGFGREGCSLAALRELPVDLLGIDDAFVQGLGEDDADETAVEAVLAVARALRLLVVASGVVTERQAAMLEGLDCRRASGPLFGEAFPAGRAGALLERPGVRLGPN